MKKFITLLILLCTVIGAKAARIEQAVDKENKPIAGAFVLTLESTDGSELNNVSSILNSSNVKELRIEGTIYSSHFQKLRDFGNLRPTTLDLSNATLLQPKLTCTYKDANGNSRTVEYSSANNSFPPIIEYNNVEYKLYYAITDKVSEYQLPSSWHECLTNLYFPVDDNFKIVNEDFCNGFSGLDSGLSNVIIPDNVKVIGKNAFRDCKFLHSVNLNKVEILCEWSFYAAAMPKVTIPGTCVYIGSYAFTDQANQGVINTLVFQKPPVNDPYPDPNHYMIIKQEAFNNMSNLHDIYINSTSNYVCENWAFSKDITYGQSNPNANFCSLHFSSEVAEHYSNLKHPLTVNIAKDPAKFHDWLIEHYQSAQGTAGKAGNGWWEFVNTGTIEPDDPPVTGGKVLRTYSDYDYDRIVPRGIKAYIVTGLTPIRVNDHYNYEVSLTQLMVIPKRTGVILYGEANSFNQNGQPILSLQPVEIANGFPLRRDYWYKLSGSDATYLKNYLWPSCVANDDTDPNCIVEELYNKYTIELIEENGKQVEVIKKDKDGNYVIDKKLHKVLAKMTGPSTVDPCDNKTGFNNDDLIGSQNEGYDNEGYEIEKLNGFYRNFYMTRYSNTDPGTGTSGNNDFVGFFRAKHSSSIKSGYAYLRLKGGTLDSSDRINTTDAEHIESTGVEVIVNADTQPYKIGDTDQDYLSYQVEYNKSNGTPEGPEDSGLWTKDEPDLIWEHPSNWGVRPSTLGVLVK